MHESAKASAGLLALFLSIGVCSGQKAAASFSFSSEDDKITDMVQIPDSVRHVLLSDDEDFPNGQQKNLHCDDHESADSGSAPVILCKKLGSSAQAGDVYLVIGVGSLRGAHILPFWIIRQDANGASLLFKTRSDGLDVSPKQFNGLPQIESFWIMNGGHALYTDSFRFDGKKFARYHRAVEHQ